MKKDCKRAILAAVMLLIVYHLVVFLIPFGKTAVFWVSYGFTLGGFAIGFFSIYVAFLKHPGAKSKFYGFPIARLGAIYLLVQVIACLVFMALSAICPLWIPILLYGILMAAAILGLTAAEAVREEIHQQDQVLRTSVAAMRALQSKANQLPGLCRDPETLAAVKAFAEELRYSDPVSSPALATADADLTACVDELQQAALDSDEASVRTLLPKASALLAERNRLCKLNK